MLSKASLFRVHDYIKKTMWISNIKEQLWVSCEKDCDRDDFAVCVKSGLELVMLWLCA